jgi:hypothetical protein
VISTAATITTAPASSAQRIGLLLFVGPRMIPTWRRGCGRPARRHRAIFCCCMSGQPPTLMCFDVGQSYGGFGEIPQRPRMGNSV